MALLDQILAHKAEITASAERHGINSVKIFGSVARGEESPNSDIDFLIQIKKPIAKPLDFLDFKFEMEGMFGRSVDVIFENSMHWAFKEAIEDEIIDLNDSKQ